MKLHELTVATREPKGKGGAREARRNATIPAILYGEDKDNVAVTLDAKSFGNIIHGQGGEHALIQLDVSDNADASGPVMVKAVQHHPVSDKVLSVDLLRIQLDKPIDTVVPINLIGQSVGIVKGGVPDQHEHSVEIRTLPLNVPEEMQADITDLDIGDTMFIESLVAIDGVEVLTPGDRTLLAIKAPRVAKSAAEEAAEAEAEAAEAGGDAAAEGDGGEGSSD